MSGPTSPTSKRPPTLPTTNPSGPSSPPVPSGAGAPSSPARLPVPTLAVDGVEVTGDHPRGILQASYSGPQPSPPAAAAPQEKRKRKGPGALDLSKLGILPSGQTAESPRPGSGMSTGSSGEPSMQSSPAAGSGSATSSSPVTRDRSDSRLSTASTASGMCGTVSEVLAKDGSTPLARKTLNLPVLEKQARESARNPYQQVINEVMALKAVRADAHEGHPGAKLVVQYEGLSVRLRDGTIINDERKALAALTRTAQSRQSLDTADDFPHDVVEAYIDMQKVAGVTLEERLKTGPLSEAESRAATRDMLFAFDYMHSRGVVHNDGKPSNIVGRVMVDFGEALTSSPEHPLIFQIDDQGGAASYRAPERTVAGLMAILPSADQHYYGAHPGAIEQRTYHGRYSDYFAVGATAFTALTGHAPPEFKGGIDPDDPVAWKTGVDKEIDTLRISDAGKDFLKRTLVLSPEKREESCRDLLRHAWVLEK